MSELDPKQSKKREKDEKRAYIKAQNDFFKAIHMFIGKFAIERSLTLRKQKEASLIDQFILNIKNIFRFSNKEEEKEKEKEQKKLLGRIHELNKNASEVLNVLNTVKDDLQNEVDEGLFEFVKLVMNPMIRDISRIQKIVKKEGAIQASGHHKAVAFNQYNQWIDRAKLWVEVCSTSKNKDTISLAILNHTFQDFINLIDRDLQLIADYQEHIFDGAYLSLNEKKKIQKEIEKGIVIPLKNLNDLKKIPENLTLDDLNKWKDCVDKKRDHLFNSILQIIDNKITNTNTNPKSKMEELDIYVGNLEQISYFEMEIPLLIKKLESISEDPFEIEVGFHQLLSLQEEIDTLYHDIGMPADIIERLQVLRKLLKKAFSKFKKP